MLNMPQMLAKYYNLSNFVPNRHIYPQTTHFDPKLIILTSTPLFFPLTLPKKFAPKLNILTPNLISWLIMPPNPHFSPHTNIWNKSNTLFFFTLYWVRFRTNDIFKISNQVTLRDKIEKITLVWLVRAFGSVYCRKLYVLTEKLTFMVEF